MKTNFVKAAVLAASLLVQAGVQANPVPARFSRVVSNLRYNLFSAPLKATFDRLPSTAHLSGSSAYAHGQVEFLEGVGFRLGVMAVGLGATTAGLGYKNYQANKEVQALHGQLQGLRNDVYKLRPEVKLSIDKFDAEVKELGKPKDNSMYDVTRAAESLVFITEFNDPVIQAAKEASRKATMIAEQKQAELGKLFEPKQ